MSVSVAVSVYVFGSYGTAHSASWDKGKREDDALSPY